jgi:23S rRNA (adenine2503-C2)-methyltransferase
MMFTDSILRHVPETLVDALAAQGMECSLADARRILCRVISDGADDCVPQRIAARKALLEHVRRHFRWDRPVVEERVEDPDDGSVRYLFRAADGARFEAVRISLHKPGRFTVCLSSQAGCAMACAFCATGRLGLGRNLTADEIVGQFLTVRDEAPGRVSGAVFMGQGEPFHNYDEVVRAAKVLSNPAGGRVAQEAVTISTVGLVQQIRRYTREGHDYKLVVSLTTARADLRRELLPVAGKIPFAELIDALREHAAALKARSKAESVGQRLTIAWVLMGGVNDGPDEVEALRELLGDLPVRINLIDVNDARPDGYRRATDDERTAFVAGLRTLGVPVVRRYSVGRSRHSACGMLASKKLAELGG